MGKSQEEPQDKLRGSNYLPDSIFLKTRGSQRRASSARIAYSTAEGTSYGWMTEQLAKRNGSSNISRGVGDDDKEKRDIQKAADLPAGGEVRHHVKLPSEFSASSKVGRFKQRALEELFHQQTKSYAKRAVLVGANIDKDLMKRLNPKLDERKRMSLLIKMGDGLRKLAKPKPVNKALPAERMLILHYVEEANFRMFASMPPEERSLGTNYKLADRLLKFPFFQGWSRDAACSLMRNMQFLKVDPGCVAIELGSVITHIPIVLSGSFVIKDRDERMLQRMVSGQWYGATELLAPPESLWAVSVEGDPVYKHTSEVALLDVGNVQKWSGIQEQELGSMDVITMLSLHKEISDRHTYPILAMEAEETQQLRNCLMTPIRDRDIPMLRRMSRILNSPKFPFLRALPELMRSHCAKFMTISHKKKGDIIMMQGEPSEYMYLLMAGTCITHRSEMKKAPSPRKTFAIPFERKSQAESEGKDWSTCTLRELSELYKENKESVLVENNVDIRPFEYVWMPGQWFGEDRGFKVLDVSEDLPQPVSVVAASPVELMTLSRQDYVMAHKLANSTSGIAKAAPYLFKENTLRSQSDNMAILEVLKKLPFMSNLDQAIQEQIVEHMSYGLYIEGEQIMEEGAPADMFYILISGEVVFKHSMGQVKRIGCWGMNGASCFGENALSSSPKNAHHTSTATVCGFTELVELDGAAYQSILAKEQRKIMKQRARFLITVPLLQGLPNATYAKLAAACRKDTYGRGSVVMQPGEIMKGLSFIESGSLNVLWEPRTEEVKGDPKINSANVGSSTVKVHGVNMALSGPGETFGDRSVLRGEAEQDMCVVESPIVIYTITKAQLQEHIPPSFFRNIMAWSNKKARWRQERTQHILETLVMDVQDEATIPPPPPPPLPPQYNPASYSLPPTHMPEFSSSATELLDTVLAPGLTDKAAANTPLSDMQSKYKMVLQARSEKMIKMQTAMIPSTDSMSSVVEWEAVVAENSEIDLMAESSDLNPEQTALDAQVTKKVRLRSMTIAEPLIPEASQEAYPRSPGASRSSSPETSPKARRALRSARTAEPQVIKRWSSAEATIDMLSSFATVARKASNKAIGPDSPQAKNSSLTSSMPDTVTASDRDALTSSMPDTVTASDHDALASSMPDARPSLFNYLQASTSVPNQISRGTKLEDSPQLPPSPAETPSIKHGLPPRPQSQQSAACMPKDRLPTNTQGKGQAAAAGRPESAPPNSRSVAGPHVGGVLGSSYGTPSLAPLWHSTKSSRRLDDVMEKIEPPPLANPPPLVGMQHRSQSLTSPQSCNALAAYDVQQSSGLRSFPARTRPSTADVRSNLDKRQHNNAVRQQAISTAVYKSDFGKTLSGDRSSAPEAQELYCPFRRMSFSS